MLDIHNFYKSRYENKIGDLFMKFLRKEDIKSLMIDAVRDGVPVVQRLASELKEEFGNLAAQDDMKQLIGYLVRKVLEENGEYAHLDYDVKIEEENMFVYGSTY